MLKAKFFAFDPNRSSLDRKNLVAAITILLLLRW
jgi:hypothetical protein